MGKTVGRVFGAVKAAANIVNVRKDRRDGHSWGYIAGKLAIGAAVAGASALVIAAASPGLLVGTVVVIGAAVGTAAAVSAYDRHYYGEDFTWS